MRLTHEKINKVAAQKSEKIGIAPISAVFFASDMMGETMNRVTLIGNVGADPDVRTFQNGGKVANLRLATSERWTDRSTGEKREKVEWHTVAIFNEGLIGVVERYVRRGSKLCVTGKLETRKWQDQNGSDRYTTEVVLRAYGGEIELLGDPRGGGAGAPPPSGGAASGPPPKDLDDEIPF